MDQPRFKSASANYTGTETGPARDNAIEKVGTITCELIARMAVTGHPHIPGSEFHVPKAAETIRRKIDVMLHAASAAVSGR